MTTTTDAQIVPREPVILPELRACRPGRGRRPYVRPLRQHRARLRRPVAHLRRLVRRGRARVPAGGAPHRGPLPGRPGRLRRRHRHAAFGHVSHFESPRVGEAGIALPGPGRARLPERMGPSAGQAPAPGRRPHRRRAGRDPAHRRPAQEARPRLRNAPAGCRKGEVRPGPGRRAVGWRVAAFRGGVADWGDVQRWDDGSGRITVVRSKTDAEAQGASVAVTPAAMQALSAIRPAGVASDVKVFGLSESQIARRVKAIARAAGLSDWEFFSGHSGRVGMARRMAQKSAPTHEIERQGR